MEVNGFNLGEKHCKERKGRPNLCLSVSSVLTPARVTESHQQSVKIPADSVKPLKIKAWKNERNPQWRLTFFHPLLKINKQTLMWKSLPKGRYMICMWVCEKLSDHLFSVTALLTLKLLNTYHIIHPLKVYNSYFLIYSHNCITITTIDFGTSHHSPQ